MLELSKEQILDKLIMDVETNGVVDAEQAIRDAARILWDNYLFLLI